MLAPDIEGEAGEVAEQHAALVQDIVAGRSTIVPPCVLISGDETSVTLRGRGRGIPARAGRAAGVEDKAGAMFGTGLLVDARDRGVDVRARLADNDGYGFFAALDTLVMTGPTLTNVNDFRAILIAAPSPV